MPLSGPIPKEPKMSDLLTLQQAAAHTRKLGQPLSYMILYRSLQDGKLPAQKVGTSWIVHKSDVEKLAATL